MLPCIYSNRVPAFTSASVGGFTNPSYLDGTSISLPSSTPNLAANPSFVQADLLSPFFLKGVFVQHCTMSKCRLTADVSNPPTTARADMDATTWPSSIYAATTASPAKAGMDRHGVVKIRGVNYNSNMVPQTFEARYIRLSDLNNDLPLGIPLAALTPYFANRATRTTAYEVGAVYVMQSARVFPRKPLAGGVRVTYERPQTVNELRGGRAVPVVFGAPYALIELDFVVGRTPDPAYAAIAGLSTGDDDIESIARIAQVEPCWLDLGIPDKPWLSWPVRFVEAAYSRRIRGAGSKMDIVTLKFRELT